MDLKPSVRAGRVNSQLTGVNWELTEGADRAIHAPGEKSMQATTSLQPCIENRCKRRFPSSLASKINASDDCPPALHRKSMQATIALQPCIDDRCKRRLPSSLASTIDASDECPPSVRRKSMQATSALQPCIESR